MPVNGPINLNHDKEGQMPMILNHHVIFERELHKLEPITDNHTDQKKKSISDKMHNYKVCMPSSRLQNRINDEFAIELKSIAPVS